jgi:hypothetical protein
MTVFSISPWHIGHMAIHEPVSAPWTITLYCLASTRIGLCLSGDNSWQRKKADGSWRIIRNIPFLLQGMIVAAWFFVHRTSLSRSETCICHHSQFRLLHTGRHILR